MTFLWPSLLWFLLALPACVALYFFVLKQKKKSAVRYASLDVIKDALGKGQAWRRHLPPAILLVALGAMIAAMARPAALITLPSQHETVILAIDVSASMRADDVQPTRIVAAQAAAREFIAGQSRSTRIGVVSFAGSAALVQPPTQNRTDILAAIDALQLQHATAVGSGILV
ncbi:MAG TPA: VWA domain-containing protein, partial [Burkholderiales bacterium]|nr:VWA domain-containing protein [Burkholderiales bacterium]